MDNLAAPVAEPMETRSPAAVKRTREPSSVQPETLRSLPVAEMVIFLLVVSRDRETPEEPARVRVSVLVPASKVVVPTLMVLKVLTLPV
ncbi:MAG: hypothetical protein UX80_C0035G0011 [Candidatus Amesbacteria bacterium GW2011_GWA2_47_11b]|uniref:Uncharacterized protein n=1 Tax=Candidatus Amesbacteria bacterium GW2011_GWA2_47_11b TaxID=1618358 RepID=A0A0G1RHA5_9BACT|nr:MAG: hypothetical protein UX80_C0035G0011 [Candidatus Amesbacteria bacterium GW2011_GWA2_47_11b]